MAQKSVGKNIKSTGGNQSTSSKSDLESILNAHPYHTSLDQLIQQYTKKMAGDDPSRYELINPIASTATSLSKNEGGKPLEDQTRMIFAAYETAHRGDELTKDIEGNMISYVDSLLGKFRENVRSNIKGNDLYDILPLLFLNPDAQGNLPGFYKNLMSLPSVRDSNLDKKTTLFNNLIDVKKDQKQRLIDYFSSLSSDVTDRYVKKGHTKEEADNIVSSAKKAYESIVNGADSSILHLLITDSTEALRNDIVASTRKIDPTAIEGAASNLTSGEYTNLIGLSQAQRQRAGLS